MIRKLLTRWAADADRAEIDRLRGELADVRENLDAERRRVAVLEAELENLWLINERNNARIKAEIAASAKDVAAAETA